MMLNGVNYLVTIALWINL